MKCFMLEGGVGSVAGQKWYRLNGVSLWKFVYSFGLGGMRDSCCWRKDFLKQVPFSLEALYLWSFAHDVSFSSVYFVGIIPIWKNLLFSPLIFHNFCKFLLFKRCVFLPSKAVICIIVEWKFLILDLLSFLSFFPSKYPRP